HLARQLCGHHRGLWHQRRHRPGWQDGDGLVLLATSGVLTVSGSGGTIATLAFSGNYTTANFNAVSDGHGGTNIVDPPAGAGPALMAQYGASMGADGPATSSFATPAPASQPLPTLAAHA